MMRSREDWVRSQCSGKILDIGSAGGWVFRGSGLDVVSLDINEFAPSEVPSVVSDAQSLPFKDNSFDCCAICECLEHVHNPILALKEAARVARDKVIVTVPDEASWTPDHLPFRTLTDIVKEERLTPEQLFERSSPTATKLNDIQQAFHNRWYTKEILESQLNYLGLPYEVQTIAYDGWGWFGGTITKKAAPENIFDRPEYWCGELGYRPTPDGIGYNDFPIHQVKVDYILSRKPKGKVLDIGCAFGYIVKRLRDKEVDAFGIDISRYALSQAPEDVKPYLKHGSADSLPWPDEYFDMVVTFSVLEHLDSELLLKAISEIKRVARRGIISVTPGDAPYFNGDITHKTKQPLSWWRNQFPPEFEVRADANEEWAKAIEKAASEGLRKLNIGSFVTMLPPPWINLDILDLSDYAKEKGFNFQQVDVTKGLPFGDKSVDHINCSHLIEHLTVSEGIAFLGECYRILKTNAVVRICAPDTRKLVEAYIGGDMDRFNPDQPDEYKQAHSQSDKFWRILTAGHKTCYDTTSITHSLELTGFKKVNLVDFNNEEDYHPEVSLSVEGRKA